MDLNVMMREQARLGLQTQLDAAVTNGDTEAARKVAADIAKLEVSTAPKAPPFGDAEIRAELNKLEWFGVDPKKSGRVLALGKDMNPTKFASAEAFAAALVKAVEAEDAPAPKAKTDDGEPGEEDEEGEEDETPPVKAKRKTDGPGEADTLGRGSARGKSGPWVKLSDAPSDVQKEVNRTADKFAPKTKEGREGFVTKALGAHYATHLRNKGKK